MDNEENAPAEEQDSSEPENPGEIIVKGEDMNDEQPIAPEPENPGEPIQEGFHLPESDDDEPSQEE